MPMSICLLFYDGGASKQSTQDPMTMQSAINIIMHTGFFPNIIENVSLGFWWHLLSTFYTSPVFIHAIIAVKSLANTTLRYHIAGVPFIIFFASTAYELNILRHLSTLPYKCIHVASKVHSTFI